LTLHHNIIVGSYDGYGEDTTKITGAVTAYSNTFYAPVSRFTAAYFDGASSGAGPFNFYNNIVYSSGASPAYDNGDFSAGALWVESEFALQAHR